MSLSTTALYTWGWFTPETSGTQPDPPSNIEVTTISTSVLLVSWDFNSYAGGFDLYRSLSLTGTFTKANSSPILDLSYYDGQENTSLSADTIYFYKVKALGPVSATDSTFSEVASGRTMTSSEAGHTYYYPETIRNVTVALLDMFNDFYIKRYTQAPARGGTIVKTVRVPITFGPDEKRHQDDLRGKTQGYQAPPVPRLAMILDGIEYDASRASGLNELRHFYDESLEIMDLDSFFQDVSPAPYNFNFTLSIRTRSVSDFSQITEQILPFFNPMRSLRVKEFSFLNIERDLPVLMGGITPTFSNDMEVSERREVDGDVALTVQGWMYRPIDAQKIIKQINSKFIISQFDESGEITPITASSYVINSSGDISGTPHI